jgi:putative ABC transport system permease protein
VRPALLASLASAALLVGTAVASLIGLQLARVADRRRELAIRAAMGANRARLGALLVGETLWWCVGGGLAALFLTYWILELVPSFVPADFPRIGSLSFSTASFLAVAATTIAIAVVVGLVVSWRAVRPELTAAITDVPPTATTSAWGLPAGRSRRWLPTIQVAIAVVLLVGAGLVCRTLVELVREDLGYAPPNLVTARLIGTGMTRARGGGRVDPDTLHRLITRLKQLPRVTGVAVSTALPFQTGSGRINFGATLLAPDGSGRVLPAPASENYVTPEYFDLLGMRVVAGRELTDHDYRRAPPAVVVNETFARAYLGPHPVGALVSRRGEVVGVVQDIKDRGPGEPVDPQMFSLYDRDQGAIVVNPSVVYLRVTGDADLVIREARAVVRDVDERLGLDGATTIQAALSAMIAEPRLYAAVAAASAAFALLVSAVGLFGLLWNSVADREREIGVRTALGATRAAIVRQILREGLAIAAAGTAAGLVGATILVQYLRSLLYHVGPFDPLVFTAVPALLVVVSVTACLLPARRAAGVDPIEALRTP